MNRKTVGIVRVVSIGPIRRLQRLAPAKPNGIRFAVVGPALRQSPLHSIERAPRTVSLAMHTTAAERPVEIPETD
jgi:hypothetical protein